MGTPHGAELYSTATGYEPPKKKQKMLLPDADMADKYLITNQPGRVPLNRIIMHPNNRICLGILPLRVHDLARDICMKGTSKRYYNHVRLVEVPEAVMQMWLSDNQKKAKLNPLLADFKAMSHTGTVYAALRCTHFVEVK